MKIGVFDSGLGGKYVADRLAELFPSDEIIYVNDRDNVPYGNRTAREIQKLTEAAIQPLIAIPCDAIVIACNSATTNAITYLRTTYPEIFFVGIEPMIKPAAQHTTTGIVGVCATPATLASPSYALLKERYAKNVTIIEPDCSSWAEAIENNMADTIDIATTVEFLTAKNCDVVVLGCTHYHYLKKRFRQAAPGMRILEPTDAIAHRIASELATARLQQQ